MTVGVTDGRLTIGNAAGSANNNKINFVDIAQMATLDFSAGFANPAGLTLNGATAVSGSSLRLTNGGANQAGSMFSSSQVGVTNCSTQFDFSTGRTRRRSVAGGARPPTWPKLARSETGATNQEINIPRSA